MTPFAWSESKSNASSPSMRSVSPRRKAAGSAIGRLHSRQACAPGSPDQRQARNKLVCSGVGAITESRPSMDFSKQEDDLVIEQLKVDRRYFFEHYSTW